MKIQLQNNLNFSCQIIGEITRGEQRNKKFYFCILINISNFFSTNLFICSFFFIENFGYYNGKLTNTKFITITFKLC